MTKIICVSKSKFEKGMFYGVWGIVTFTLLLFSSLNWVEIHSYYETEKQKYWFDSDEKEKVFCYKTILTGEELCNAEPKSFKFWYFLIGNLINFTVIGSWIYHKQQKFKFSWCLNDKGES